MAVHELIAKEYGRGWLHRGYVEQEAAAIEAVVRSQLTPDVQWRVRFVYGDERAQGIYIKVKLLGNQDDLGQRVEGLVVATMENLQAFK